MEPFIVANQIYDINGYNEKIYKTTQAESHISNNEYIYYFNNIEQDCAISRFSLDRGESYIIPANTYYLIDDSEHDPTTDLYFSDIVFFTGKGITTRTFNFGNLPYDGTSMKLTNINVRAFYE